MNNKVGDAELPNRRTVHLNDRVQNQALHKKFDNEIKTSKYTWWNFLPKALILQFMRAANLYFLASTVISCISIISPIQPFSAIFPLVLVMAVSLSREAIEDYRRHRNDDLVNEQKTLIFNNKNFTSILWKDLQIGDIIKVNCEQVLPADILLIATNEETGIGFVETANLDGERNLKCKTVNEAVNKFGRELPLVQFKGKIVCDKPNNSIHNFKGLLYLDAHREPIMLSNANIMLRGTTLKNTDWAVGLIIYSGQDTKIMKNQGQVKNKTTHIEKLMNPIIFITIVLQSGLCIAAAILNVQFQRDTYPLYRYLYGFSDDGVYSDWVQGILNNFTYFLLLNTLVPISLIISLEVAKLFQTSWIEYDYLMHYTLEDGSIQPMKVLNTLIHEELGKIDCIFTDKTGTLTSNSMVFRHANIVGQDYNEAELEKIKSVLNLETLSTNKQYQEFYHFWLCIALCHEVLLDERDGKVAYQGSSPDEVCLVEAANKFGIKFCKRTATQIFLQVGTEMLTYKLLHKIEFSSDRKRMSIIVEETATNKIFMYSKGADSFFMKNLSAKSDSLKRKAKDSLKAYSKQGLRTLCLGMKEIEGMEYEKWRNQYDKCQMQIAGIMNLENNEKKQQSLESEIETGFELLGVTALEDKLQEGVPEILQEIKEAGISVWMLTGDKLETAENIGYLCNLLDSHTKVFRIQSSHPQTTRDKLFRIKGKINELKTMNDIGDIKQPFIAIDKNHPSFIHPEVPKVQSNIGGRTAIHLENQGSTPPASLKANSNNKDSHTPPDLKDSFGQSGMKDDSNKDLFSNQSYSRFALVIEGEVIGHALQDAECANEFLQIIPECSSLICCRSTPTQKAEVVQFVKKHFNKTCLAIGDGGNDVTMIQEADIGVGIIGKEGNQAALSSDYYFGQFRFLSRLLFVHGRWNLFRSSYFVNYFFLKNFVFTIQQFLFAFFCGYSGQSFWEDGYLLLFNSVVTACAPVYYAGFEQDVNEQKEDGTQSKLIHSQLPILYKEFRSADLFSYKQFWKMMVMGTFFACTIFFSVYFICYDGIISESGRVDGLWYMSVLAYTCTVGVVWAILFMDTRYFSLFTLFGYFPMSIVLFFPLFMFIWDNFTGPVQYMLITYLGNLKFWLTLFLNVGFVCVIMHLVKIYNYLINPQLIQKLELHVHNLKLGNQEEEEKKSLIQQQIELGIYPNSIPACDVIQGIKIENQYNVNTEDMQMYTIIRPDKRGLGQQAESQTKNDRNIQLTQQISQTSPKINNTNKDNKIINGIALQNLQTGQQDNIPHQMMSLTNRDMPKTVDQKRKKNSFQFGQRNQQLKANSINNNNDDMPTQSVALKPNGQIKQDGGEEEDDNLLFVKSIINGENGLVNFQNQTINPEKEEGQSTQMPQQQTQLNSQQQALIQQNKTPGGASTDFKFNYSTEDIVLRYATPPLNNYLTETEKENRKNEIAKNIQEEQIVEKYIDKYPNNSSKDVITKATAKHDTTEDIEENNFNNANIDEFLSKEKTEYDRTKTDQYNNPISKKLSLYDKESNIQIRNQAIIFSKKSIGEDYGQEQQGKQSNQNSERRDQKDEQ